MNPLAVLQDQLTGASCQLSFAWDTTKEVWHDSACQDFETNFWTEFEMTTTSSIEKLRALTDTIAQARREMP
jgi:hypothetical protein